MKCPLQGTCWLNRQGLTGEHYCIYCGAQITNKIWDFVHHSDEEATKPGFTRTLILGTLDQSWLGFPTKNFIYRITPIKHSYTQIFSGYEWRLAKAFSSVKVAKKELARLDRLLSKRPHLHQWWTVVEVEEEFGLYELKDII